MPKNTNADDDGVEYVAYATANKVAGMIRLPLDGTFFHLLFFVIFQFFNARWFSLSAWSNH